MDEVEGQGSQLLVVSSVMHWLPTERHVTERGCQLLGGAIFPDGVFRVVSLTERSPWGVPSPSNLLVFVITLEPSIEGYTSL